MVSGPAAAPERLIGTALSSTAVSFVWDLIPVLLRKGIIRGYKIHFISLESPPHTGDVQFVGGSLQQGYVPGLRFWTYHNFSIYARTVKGYGPGSHNITLRTEEHSKLATRYMHNFPLF